VGEMEETIKDLEDLATDRAVIKVIRTMKKMDDKIKLSHNCHKDSVEELASM